MAVEVFGVFVAGLCAHEKVGKVVAAGAGRVAKQGAPITVANCTSLFDRCAAPTQRAQANRQAGDASGQERYAAAQLTLVNHVHALDAGQRDGG